MVSIFKHKDNTTRLNAYALFVLLAALQMLKGIKDSMALEVGLDKLQWLITSSFLLIALLSLVSYRYMSGQNNPLHLLSTFFTIGLLTSYFTPYSSFIQYILIAGFSLVIVSQFWKNLTRINQEDRGKAFSHIAIVGSLGGIFGPFLSIVLMSFIGVSGIAIVALLLLLGANILIPRAQDNKATVLEQPVPLENPGQNGLWITAFICTYALISTLIYVKQLQIVDSYLLTSDQRALIFNIRDAFIGVLLILLQTVLSRKKIQTKSSLSMLPALAMIVLILISLVPTIGVVITAIILFKSYNYAFVRPAREMFFSLTPSIMEHKSTIDALVYRSGDLIGIWLIYSLNLESWSYWSIGLLLSPIFAFWFWSSHRIQLRLNTVQ